jgi:hypothetical protein
MRDAEARIRHLRLAHGEASGELQVALADLEEPRAADRVAARLQPAREIGGHPPARTRDLGEQRVLRLGRRGADERLDGLVGVDEAEIGEADRQQAVEGIVRFDDQPLLRAQVRDARAPAGDAHRVARGLERGQLVAVEDRRGLRRRAEPRDPHRLRARGEHEGGGAVADRRAVLPHQRGRHGEVRRGVEIGGQRLGTAVEGRERVARAQRVRAQHEAREHVGDAAPRDAALAHPRLRDQRDQRGHGEAEAALLRVHRLRHDRGGDLGGDHLHALAGQHEHRLELARGHLVVGLVEGGGARRGGRLAAHRGNAGQAEAVRDLRGDVRAVLELLAVHDADLHGIEAALGAVFERLAVGLGEQVEDGAEDAAGQVDLGEADRRDVHVLGHGGRE